MTQRAEASSTTGRHPLTLPAVRKLLDDGHYARVADLIRQVRAMTQDAPDALSNRVLSAANRICIACERAREEAERHRRSWQKARHRESETLAELGELLDLFAEHQKATNPTEAPARARNDSTAGSDRVMAPAAVAVMARLLGSFRLDVNHRAVDGWPSCRSKWIFKYLVTHRERPVPKEILMECFWPDASPDAARNNLNVAIHGLRKTLSSNDCSISHILFREGCYLINPALHLWVDVEAFRAHVREAQRLERRRQMALAVEEYQRAEALYRGDFLEDDRYHEWADPIRHELRECYRALCYRLSEHYLQRDDVDGCESICQKLLALDPCDEASHRQLMCCYSRQGHLHRALRQFEICAEALRRELDVEPGKVTLELRRRLRSQQPV